MPPVSFDQDLADRLRAALSFQDGVTESRMFGGLAFLVKGHMSVVANRNGAMMLRVDPEVGQALLDRPGIQPFKMRGREMGGWLLAEAEATSAEEQLQELVDHSLAFVAGLPPKS